MDSFPSNLTRKNCISLMEQKQLELTKVTRDDFYKIIMKGINDCEKEVTLRFNDKLWDNHRIKVAGELLEIFGEINISTIQNKCIVTKCTTDKNNLPDKIKEIRIQFCTE